MTPRPREPRRRAARRTETEILSGFHSVREALRARRRSLHRLWLQAGHQHPELAGLRKLAYGLDLPIVEVGPESLPRGTPAGSRSQGFCLEAGPLPLTPLGDLVQGPPPRWVVALDGIQDPQNLGAIVRVVDAAGALGIVLQERRTAPLTPAVSRASAGALEHVAVARVINLPSTLKRLKSMGFWVLGAEAEADADLFEAPRRLLEGDLVLALGAEGKGLRRGVRAAVDAFLRIPMAGRVASLNVATAAAVFLFEWRRRSRSDASSAPHSSRRSGSG